MEQRAIGRRGLVFFEWNIWRASLAHGVGRAAFTRDYLPMIAAELAGLLFLSHGVTPSLICLGWLFHNNNTVCLVVLLHFNVN